MMVSETMFEPAGASFAKARASGVCEFSLCAESTALANGDLRRFDSADATARLVLRLRLGIACAGAAGVGVGVGVDVGVNV